MSNEINGVGDSVRQLADLASPRQGATRPDAGGAPKGAAAAQESVEITASASRLQQLEQGLQSVPVVDTQRVAALREAIESGNYEVNPERVAEKVIEFEQQRSGDLNNIE